MSEQKIIIINNYDTYVDVEGIDSHERKTKTNQTNIIMQKAPPINKNMFSQPTTNN